MNRDELRGGINRILFHVLSNEERADKIAELIAPILADAAKWRKVEEIAKRARKDDGCRGCPLEKSGCHPCYNAITVVNALSEVPDGH